MHPGQKLYAISHRELSPGYQAVQSSHAYLKFAIEHPEQFKRWYEISKYLCILSVASEDKLRSLYMEAQSLGIRCSAFLEPDIDYAMTAICLEPGNVSKRLCSKLPLLLSEL